LLLFVTVLYGVMLFVIDGHCLILLLLLQYIYLCLFCYGIVPVGDVVTFVRCS
jgi:hypothetical protein